MEPINLGTPKQRSVHLEANKYYRVLNTALGNKISHSSRSSSPHNKIPHSYSFLCLEWMALKIEKILLPFYEKKISSGIFIIKNILESDFFIIRYL